MRNGFTSGSCAAAAAKAAAYMLFFNTIKESVSIITPANIVYEPQILDIDRLEKSVSCAVRKDSGDDPDVTNGILIYAKVEIICEDNKAKDTDGIEVIIDGGIGVGRVTKPGLDQPIGAAAINHVPRQMITEAVSEVAAAADFSGKIKVSVYVPEGEEVARKTFNPRLGIEGGISIIGTSGIVEPMSTKAILDTIRVELNQRKALGYDYVAVSPGNYGRDFIKKNYNYDIDKCIKCSNYIGDTIEMAIETGFDRLLLAGHIGKLIKVSGGMMNTHSKEGDCRMELLAAAAIKEGISAKEAGQILDCVVTEEAINIIDGAGMLDNVMKRVMDRIIYQLDKRFADRIKLECIVYSNDRGVLCASRGAEEWLNLLAQEQAQ